MQQLLHAAQHWRSALPHAAEGKQKKETATTRRSHIGCRLIRMAATSVSNYGDTPFAKELQKRLNVKIEYQHPTQGSELEKFNLLVASDSLPDIIEYIWANYPGGPSKAIKDNIIQPIDIPKKAPNLYSYIKKNPEIEKMMKTDDGEYFSFPFIRGERSLQTSAGPNNPQGLA